MTTINNSALPAEGTETLTFSLTNGGRLKISAEALATMREFLQDTVFKCEAGGVLLGRYIKNSSDIVVDLVTPPQKDDKRSRFRFFRKKEDHQAIIEQVWKESEGTCNYLGDWHTHPEPIPVPSGIDIKSWERQVRKTKFYGECMYFIIVGTEELALFEININNSKPTKLSLQ